MVISVRVTAGAKKNLWKEDSGVIKVYVRAPAVDGQANKALCCFVAEHFRVAKSCVAVIKGLKSRNKTIKIEGI